MKIYKCDKCERQIEQLWKIQIEGKQTDPVIMMLQKIDLCETCYKKIYSELDDFATYKEEAYGGIFAKRRSRQLCSNGKPCTHPNCKRCGTTHFMSDCDYGKEQ